MFPLNAFSAPAFLAGLLNAVLLVSVYLYAPQGRLRRVFLYWTLWLGLWNGWLAIGYGLPDASVAYNWYKYLGAVIVRFLAPLFLHFVMVLTENLESRLNQRILLLAYASGALFAVLDSVTPWLMSGVHQYFWGYYPLAAPGDVAFGISFFAIVAYAFRFLWGALQASERERREQLRCVFYGAAIAFTGGITNFLPLYGHAIYPVGNLLNSIYAVAVAYAILGFGMMDIRIIVEKGTVYGMMCSALMVVYFSMVSLMKHIFGSYGISEDVVFYTAAVPVTVVLAPSMKTRLEPWVRSFIDAPVPPLEIPAEALKKTQMENMRLIGMVSAELAHELSKPLTHIVNEGVRLEKGLFQSYKESIARIDREARRASQILDSFALLSPDRELYCEPVMLQDVLDEALAATLQNDPLFAVNRRYAPISKVRLHRVLAGQILGNILLNAVQAMPEGGVLDVAIVPTREGQTYRIEITDEGPGIPPDLLPRIFDPFVTTKAAYGGRGVGLTLSRAMTERHGGSLTAQSPVQNSRGTRIIVTMPFAPPQKAQ